MMEHSPIIFIKVPGGDYHHKSTIGTYNFNYAVQNNTVGLILWKTFLRMVNSLITH